MERVERGLVDLAVQHGVEDLVEPELLRRVAVEDEVEVDSPPALPGSLIGLLGGPISSGGTVCGLKVAVTWCGPFIVTLQSPEPLQSPPHETNWDPGAGIGKSPTVVCSG